MAGRPKPLLDPQAEWESRRKEDVKDVPISGAGCPMDGCDGNLTQPYKINDDPQYAIACTHCEWWTLA